MKLKFKYLLILISVVTVCSIEAICDKSVKEIILDDIYKQKSYEIYKAIQDKVLAVLHAQTLNDNFIDAWKEFYAYTECANSVVKADRYKTHIDTFDKSKKFIGDIIIKFEKNILPSEEYIASINKKSKDFKERLDLAFSLALEEINSSLERPATWRKAVLLSSAEKIYPDYKSFFATYENFKKQLVKAKKVDDQRVINFIFKNPKLTSKTVATFVDKLEKLQYFFEEELKKKAWYSSKSDLEKMIASSKEIVKLLQKNFPSITTSLRNQKIPLSKNAAAHIILSETEGLYDILTLIEDYFSMVTPGTLVKIKK